MSPDNRRRLIRLGVAIGAGLGVFLAGQMSHAAEFDANGNGVVRLDSAAGPITVSPDFGEKIIPLIAELKAMGFEGRVKCFAARRGGHVPGSLHLTGNACDFLPSGRAARGHNRMPTTALMFTRKVADLIARYGLRNGCSFRDCGHIDSGKLVARHNRRKHYAEAAQ